MVARFILLMLAAGRKWDLGARELRCNNRRDNTKYYSLLHYLVLVDIFQGFNVPKERVSTSKDGFFKEALNKSFFLPPRKSRNRFTKIFYGFLSTQVYEGPTHCRRSIILNKRASLVLRSMIIGLVAVLLL